MEELKDLLFCASLELERAGANAEAQSQLQEARLLHLQELLAATRRERDEARDQLLKLEQSQSLEEYCNMITNAQQHVLKSNDRSTQWLDTDLDVNPSSTMHYNSFCQTAHPPTLLTPSPHNDSSPLLGPTDQFLWNSTPAHHLDLRPDLYLHQSPTSCSNVHFSNLMDLNDQPFYHHDKQQLGLIERQESEQQQVESHLLGSPPILAGGTPEAMPDHLPEPHVTDIEVSENALPERGKLLKAVIQAGPLLQTLLMTGPLPAWRNPPPALDSVEIPRISIFSSPNSTIPVGPLVHHVPNPHGPVDDPLQVNSAVSSCDNSLLPWTRINKPPTAAFVTSGQSVSEAAASSSKLLFAPVLNSMDSSITASLPSGSEAAASSSKLLFAPVLNSMESSITASLPLKFARRH